MIVVENNSVKKEINRLETKIEGMSKQEMREMILINSYKLALVRSQIEAITEILIKNKVTTYEEIWKKTDTNFKNSTV